MKTLLTVSVFVGACLMSCSKNNSSTSTPAKTTGHIYCALAGNYSLYRYGRPGLDTLSWKRISSFDVSLLEQGVALLDKQSNKDTVTIDMGEWNPGTYELNSTVMFLMSRTYKYTMQCDTTFQVQANVDQTIKMDDWYQ